MTVYLSVVIPLISILGILKTQIGIQITLENMARDLAQKAYYTEGIVNSKIAQDTIADVANKYSNLAGNNFEGQIEIENKEVLGNVAFAAIAYGAFINEIKLENINDSYIVGGVAGLDFSGSQYDAENGIVIVKLRYCTRIPMVSAFVGILPDERTAIANLWVGKDITKEIEKVYITKNGEVYHTTLNCTHLTRTTKSVSIKDIEKEKNNSGDIYTECDVCQGSGEIVYITQNGEKYHFSSECKALNRNVITVDKNQIADMRCCSKCEKEIENMKGIEMEKRSK